MLAGPAGESGRTGCFRDGRGAYFPKRRCQKPFFAGSAA
jgi:hypothetical protein